MPRFLVYMLIFSAGVTCGIALMVDREPLGNPGTTPVSPAEDSMARANVQPLKQLTPPNTEAGLEEAQDRVFAVQSIETMANIATNDRFVQGMPDYYRDTIGPVPDHETFGSRFQVFEKEPIDEPWAYAMETGINDLIAKHGQASGEVFEFVQCRYSYCALAGYTHDGQESRGQSAIDRLSKQPWWQGSRRLFANYSDKNGRTSFVLLIPRFED